DAVLGVVLNYADLLRAEVLGQQLGRRRALRVVVAQAAEERLPAVLGQRRVGRRRGDLRQARLVEDVARGLRLTGERQADDTHDLLGVDHLGDDARRLLRNTLGLELLELDLTRS